jgi:hypothetical protein
LRNARGEDDPRPFPPELVIEVKALACELPSRLGLPLSRLQVSDIRSEVITRGLTAEISRTTIWRWLAEDAIRPWAHHSWIFPRAPDFEPTAARVLETRPPRPFVTRAAVQLGMPTFLRSPDVSRMND